MAMRCGACRTAVEADAETCPRCGAPRTQFREAELGPGTKADATLPGPADSGIAASGDGRRPIGLRTRVWIGVTIVLVLFVALAYYSKQSHLDSVRRKCIATFALESRCDCIVNEIAAKTYAVSFVPMLRFVSGLTQQKLADIIRESAMACVETR